ncbi:amidohydrolase family protein [Aquibacillus albus]|uniref:Cytosine/adenosine deaminase-related metal-dependent hydrolase n=1 Tax=Aquibacillus albus TaxID=1168171 RepID=A0ABS2MWG7_9BACI|nr:amidohydrolase family protein [Aquibacillus albus]MBM7570045.1 cytosine/adenosine deaminase-related metal-dependent hydrolase [Aquibacillus albus]
MIDLLLVHGVIITMDEHRRIIEDGGIAIHKGKILDVGTTQELLSNYEANDTIDCKNHCLLPGLIDTHGHGGHSMFKTVAMDYPGSWMPVMTETYKHFVTDDFWYYEGKLSALERLKSGVTTGVSVLGSTPRSDDPIFAINHAKAYSEVGVREVVCTGPCNPPWPQKFSRWKGDKRIEKEVTYQEALNGTEAVIEALHHSYEDHIRAFITPFVIVTSINPSHPTPPDQLFGLTDHDFLQAKKIREIAKKYNTRIHSDAFGGMVHLAIQDRDNALLGPDVHLQHCRGISFDEARILAETGTNVSASPSFGQIPARTPIPELIELGATVAVSTDGTAPATSFDMFQAIRKMQVINQAALRDFFTLSPGKLLEMITIDAAKCLGWDDELGSLEIGKRADVIAVDMYQPHLVPNYMYIHRLVHQAVAHDVNHVIVNGKVLMRDRSVETVDENQILEEANEEAFRTVTQAGLEKYMNTSDAMWGKARLYVDPINDNSKGNDEEE